MSIVKYKGTSTVEASYHLYQNYPTVSQLLCFRLQRSGNYLRLVVHLDWDRQAHYWAGRKGKCSLVGQDLAASHPDVAKPGKAIYLNGTNERMCVLMDCLPFVLYRA